MVCREFKGPDLSEAIIQAGAALGLPPEQVKFLVVTTGSRGFLGLGRRSACISVDLEAPSVEGAIKLALKPGVGPGKAESEIKAGLSLPEAPPKVISEVKNLIHENSLEGSQVEKYPLTKYSPGNKYSSVRHSDEKYSPVKYSPDKYSSAKYSAEKHPTEKQNTSPEKSIPPSIEPSPTPIMGLDKSPSVTSEFQGPSKFKSYEAKPFPLEWVGMLLPPTHPGPGEVVAIITEAEAKDYPGLSSTLTVTRNILKHLSIEAQITAKRIGPRLAISIDSPDNALLIGSHGVTLEALQLLVSKIVLRQTEFSEADRPQIIIDVADYQARRWEQLMVILKNTVAKVHQTQRPQAINNLNPSEKRLILIAIQPLKDLLVKNQRDSDGLTICPVYEYPKRYRGGRPQ